MGVLFLHGVLTSRRAPLPNDQERRHTMRRQLNVLAHILVGLADSAVATNDWLVNVVVEARQQVAVRVRNGNILFLTMQPLHQQDHPYGHSAGKGSKNSICRLLAELGHVLEVHAVPPRHHRQRGRHGADVREQPHVLLRAEAHEAHAQVHGVHGAALDLLRGRAQVPQHLHGALPLGAQRRGEALNGGGVGGEAPLQHLCLAVDQRHAGDDAGGCVRHGALHKVLELTCEGVQDGAVRLPGTRDDVEDEGLAGHGGAPVACPRVLEVPHPRDLVRRVLVVRDEATALLRALHEDEHQTVCH
eukprot:PhM_4_TR14215/c0_g1_i4/m.101407